MKLNHVFSVLIIAISAIGIKAEAQPKGICFTTLDCETYWLKKPVSPSQCARELGELGHFAGSWQELGTNSCENLEAVGPTKAKCLNPFFPCRIGD